MQRANFTSWCLLWSVVLGASGCSLAPKNFRDMLAPAPIVRARAVELEKSQPESVAVPALISRLSDPDEVVRMNANNALKDRTHQDFHFDWWAKTAEERQPAVDRWQNWWATRSPQAAYPKDDELRKVAAQPDRKRRRRRIGGGQGGPTPWPNTQQSPPQPSTDPSIIAP